MTDLTLEDYTEYAHHLREAGQTVTADVIDALVAEQGIRGLLPM
jgi:hypothetical protein